ncbi:unnamed protein product [Moneuplotes crassus]|uniref:Uncharacterized protein n=1 Tax=Euplotes crassus TaxID=5936 RepID=A0AAD1U4V6_EUPCR|nr:unnamed protein product [Moneuplotes crassus]
MLNKTIGGGSASKQRSRVDLREDGAHSTRNSLQSQKKMNYHPQEFDRYTSLSKIGSHKIDFTRISTMLDEYNKKKARRRRKSGMGLYSENSKKNYKSKKKLVKKNSVQAPKLTEKQKKFNYYYKPYKCEEELQEAHMKFGDPINNKFVNKKALNKTLDFLVEKFNWDPISTLILRTRYKKFSKILSKINHNYVENSRKLLEMYPQETGRIIVNKERILEGEGSLSNVFMNAKETIDTSVKKMFLGKILKTQNRIDNAARKSNAFSMKTTERAASVVNKTQDINITFNDVKISKFHNKRKSGRKVKTSMTRRVRGRTCSKFKSSKNKLKNVLEKSSFGTDYSMSMSSKYSFDSEMLVTAFDNYSKTQKHKFVPRTTIQAINAREKSYLLREKKLEKPTHSRKSKSFDFKFNNKIAQTRKIHLKSRIMNRRRTPENLHSKKKTPYSNNSILEMPSINVNLTNNRFGKGNLTLNGSSKSQEKKILEGSLPSKTHKLVNIYSFDNRPVTEAHKGNKRKGNRTKLYHLKQHKIEEEIKGMVDPNVYNNSKYVIASSTRLRPIK